MFLGSPGITTASSSEYFDTHSVVSTACHLSNFANSENKEPIWEAAKMAADTLIKKLHSKADSNSTN